MAARRSSFDDKLARLQEIGRSGDERAAPELARFLTETNAFLVVEAAKIAAKLELRKLAPDLDAAFERLRKGSDPGCRGKAQIVESLIVLEADSLPVYYAGLKHVQREPYGTTFIDAAAGLRGLCAHALVRMDVPGAAFDVAPLLFDQEEVTRLGAAEALAQTGEELCAALLYSRVLAGEVDTDVLCGCYKGMLSLAPRRYLPIVGEALSAGREAAALALGESRLPQALPYLQKALDSPVSDIEDAVLLGIALLRSEEATSFLLEVISNAPEVRATRAIEALALHRHEMNLVSRAEVKVAARKSKKLSRIFLEKFGKG